VVNANVQPFERLRDCPHPFRNNLLAIGAVSTDILQFFPHLQARVYSQQCKDCLAEEGKKLTAHFFRVVRKIVSMQLPVSQTVVLRTCGARNGVKLRRREKQRETVRSVHTHRVTNVGYSSEGESEKSGLFTRRR